jgi:uncharacterized membrane protein
LRRAGVAVVSVLVSMGLFDALWLGTMVPRFYRPELGDLLATQPALLPAAVFYVLYAAGVSLFVVLPSLARDRSSAGAGLLGAAFGLVAYGTYNLTNMATIEGWPTVLTIVDMIWGAALTATVSLIAVWMARRYA